MAEVWVRSSLSQSRSSSVLCRFRDGVSLPVKGSFTLFAVDKGSTFPPGSQTSVIAGFVCALDALFNAELQMYIFRKRRDFCVHCLLHTAEQPSVSLGGCCMLVAGLLAG